MGSRPAPPFGIHGWMCGLPALSDRRWRALLGAVSGGLAVPGGRSRALRCGETKEGDKSPHLGRRELTVLVYVCERPVKPLRFFGHHAASRRTLRTRK